MALKLTPLLCASEDDLVEWGLWVLSWEKYGKRNPSFIEEETEVYMGLSTVLHNLPICSVKSRH